MNISDLPAPFSGPAAWVANDLASDPKSWLLELTPLQITELEQAAELYLSTGKDIGDITSEQFQLNTLGSYFSSLRHKLLHENGLQVIRGLPSKSYSLEKSACIFCGIGSHIGSARSQNAQGHILGHVRDTGKSSSDPSARIYQTAERQTFHTDSADIVGLLCLQAAKSGGDSLLVSALSIYNRFHEQRPDLLPLLFEPIATDRRGEIPSGAKPYMEIPVLSWEHGFLTVFYQRQYIESAQRFKEVPRLTLQQIEALDLFDSIANDPEMYFTMRLQSGDMQFVYNHSQLHDRTGFEDWPGETERRHMLRLWLSPEGDRPLPTCFKQRYGSIEVGARGGIITENTRLHAPLDPGHNQ